MKSGKQREIEIAEIIEANNQGLHVKLAGSFEGRDVWLPLAKVRVEVMTYNNPDKNRRSVHMPAWLFDRITGRARRGGRNRTRSPY